LAKRSGSTPAPAKPAPRLSRPQRVAWLRLIRSENVGPATFRALVNEFGGAEAAIAALPMLSRRGGRAHEILLSTENEAEAELERAESLGASLVAVGEPGYPPALAHVDAPPPLLYIKGRADLADFPIALTFALACAIATTALAVVANPLVIRVLGHNYLAPGHGHRRLCRCHGCRGERGARKPDCSQNRQPQNSFRHGRPLRFT
jgi:hypothetical protein